MSNLMKLLFAVLVGIITVSCGSSKEERVLYVGTNAEYEPYEYFEGDKIVGFDIDFMEEIAKKLDYTIEWSNMTFDGLIPALQTKKIDLVIAGMVPTPERAKSVDFTQIYYSNSEAVLVNEDSDIKTEEDLIGKVIGVQLGTLQEQIASEIEGTDVRQYNSFTGAILDLNQRKIDSVIVAEVVAKKYLANNPALKLALLLADHQDGSAIALSKGQGELLKKLNTAIDELKASGKHQELIKKYFDE